MNKGKINASLKALEYISSNTKLGVGTGSTVEIFIDLMHKNNIQPEVCVASSEKTKSILNKNHFNCISFNECYNLDLYIDSTDAYDEDMQLIKGHGGALFREKIIATASKKFICIADSSKKNKCLSNTLVPVEVLPFAISYVSSHLRHKFKLESTLRPDFTTDNGNKILNVKFNDSYTFKTAADILDNITGVIEHGIFIGDAKADILIIE